MKENKYDFSLPTYLPNQKIQGKIQQTHNIFKMTQHLELFLCTWKVER